MELVRKLTATEQARFDRLRALAEAKVRRALDAFVYVGQSDDMLRRVIALLETGRVEDVLTLIGTHINVLGNVVPQVFTEVAVGQIVDLGAQLLEIMPNSAVGISFDPTYPRAAD